METARVEARSGAASRLQLLAGLMVVVAALIPRLIGLDNAVTIDEPQWIERSNAFYDGLSSGHLSRTYQSPHPGVTTMWLAGAGLRLVPEGDDPEDPFRRARIPFAVVTALGIGAVWAYARRLFGVGPATAAGLLLAFDPFLLHHSRVIHTDALVSLAMLLATLAFLQGMRTGKGFGASGIFTGLALLTKGTALFLIPFLLGTLAVRDAGSVRAAFSRETFGRLWRHPGVRRYALGAAATFVVLWPAVWVRPWDALAAPFLGAGRGAVLAQERNFFFGRTPRDPGPAFYPVAIAYRMTPVVLVGAVAAVIAILRRRHGDEPRRDQRVLVWFALLFVVLITPGAKKLDRFGLPSLIALEAVAGIWMGAWFARLASRAKTAVVATTLIALHVGPGLAVAPNYLASFNWMLGGPPVARHVLLSGGGEGLDRAAEILNELGATSVASTRRTGVVEVFRGRVVGIEEGPAEYVLFYVSSVQTRVARGLWEQYRRLPPVATVRIGGVTKAWIWRAAYPPNL